MKLKEIPEKIKKIKNIEIILAVIIGLIILIIYFLPASGSGTADSRGKTEAAKTDVCSVAERLAQVLSCIKGAGEVTVMITYESDGELVPAYQQDISETKNTNGSQVTYSRSESNKLITVYEQGTATALILTEKKPQVKGVIVIAEGAADLTVRLNLFKAVQTVLQVNANKVDIFEMG